MVAKDYCCFGGDGCLCFDCDDCRFGRVDCDRRPVQAVSPHLTATTAVVVTTAPTERRRGCRRCRWDRRPVRRPPPESLYFYAATLTTLFFFGVVVNNERGRLPEKLEI